MNSENKSKVYEIKERWANNMKDVCETCMYEAIRHWDRNMDHACVTYDENEHPGRYDGDVYCRAGGDIKALLEIIEQLNNEVRK